MAKEIPGVDVLIYVGDEKIAGQRNTTIKITGDAIDVTTKDDGNWKASDTGLLAWSCSLDLVEYVGDKGRQQAAFMRSMLEGDTVNVRIIQKGRLVMEGPATVSSKTINGETSNISTGSYEINGAGELKYYFVPFIEKVTGTGTTVSIQLTEKGTTTVEEADLATAIKIGGTNPSVATLSEGVISCTVTSVVGGETVEIAPNTLKNMLAIQTSMISGEVVANA